MAFSSTLIRRFSLLDNDAGATLGKLAIVSLVASNSSLIISLLSSRTTFSIILACAWLSTLLHHLTIWRLLTKSQEEAATTPTDVPPCLKHTSNICLLFLLSITWLFDGSVRLAFIIISLRHGFWFSGLLRLVSSGLAVIEGITLISLGMLCWKLSRDAPVRLGW